MNCSLHRLRTALPARTPGVISALVPALFVSLVACSSDSTPTTTDPNNSVQPEGTSITDAGSTAGDDPSEVKDLSGATLKLRVMGWIAAAVIAAERTAGRLGAPFVADGLIVVARPGEP